jgi:hypothetical protein
MASTWKGKKVINPLIVHAAKVGLAWYMRGGSIPNPMNLLGSGRGDLVSSLCEQAGLVVDRRKDSVSWITDPAGRIPRLRLLVSYKRGWRKLEMRCHSIIMFPKGRVPAKVRSELQARNWALRAENGPSWFECPTDDGEVYFTAMLELEVSVTPRDFRANCFAMVDEMMGLEAMLRAFVAP